MTKEEIPNIPKDMIEPKIDETDNHISTVETELACTDINNSTDSVTVTEDEWNEIRAESLESNRIEITEAKNHIIQIIVTVTNTLKC